MSAARQALVIGGGIAGPAAAMALLRAGIGATVFEAEAATPVGAGAFLTIAPNGLDALRVLDLDRQVLGVGFSSPGIEIFSGTGKRLGRVPLGGIRPGVGPAQSVKRADLHRVLSEEARRRGISIEHGKRLVGAELRGGRVIAQFGDGSRAAGDLLVGADGVHSFTRRLIDPGAPSPRRLRLGNVAGFTQVKGIKATGGSYVMIFGRRAFFGYTVAPSGEIWWFANPGLTGGLSPEELACMTSERRKDLLLALFADDVGVVTEIIRSTHGEVVATSQYDLPTIPTWSRGPMVVMGDAAHAASPSSGQGASMAAEDAVALARCLRDLPDVGRAFAEFERLRRPRVERVVAFGTRSGSGKAPGRFTQGLRDLLLPVVLRFAERQSQGWLFDHHVEWDEPVAREARAGRAP